MATTAPRAPSKLYEIPSGLQMADSGCRGRGLFFNYVDKKRWVGGTGNVNGMQIFRYNSTVVMR